MAGVLPATLWVALRSKIAPGDFVNKHEIASCYVNKLGHLLSGPLPPEVILASLTSCFY